MSECWHKFDLEKRYVDDGDQVVDCEKCQADHSVAFALAWNAAMSIARLLIAEMVEAVELAKSFDDLNNTYEFHLEREHSSKAVDALVALRNAQAKVDAALAKAQEAIK